MGKSIKQLWIYKYIYIFANLGFNMGVMEYKITGRNEKKCTRAFHFQQHLK